MLSDPQKRREYDQGSRGNRKSRRGTRANNFDFDFDDFFKHFDFKQFEDDFADIFKHFDFKQFEDDFMSLYRQGRCNKKGRCQ